MDPNQAENSNYSVPPTPPPSQNSTPNNAIAILAYLGILIVIPFLTDAKNDPFVKFHIKQGLVLIVLEVVSWFLMTIPVLGWFIGSLLWLFTVIMVITGIINVLSGNQKELPLIGHLASNFNF